MFLILIIRMEQSIQLGISEDLLAENVGSVAEKKGSSRSLSLALCVIVSVLTVSRILHCGVKRKV
jgi:hypothetical protein